MKINLSKKATAAGVALALLAGTGSALAQDAPSSTYAFSGYIKFDAMFSDYSDGRLASGSIGEQFYIPATIPVSATGEGDSTTTFQARESRINFKSDHKLANGKTASTFIEMDFFLSPGGDERISNSYNPRLRHAFLKYDKWLFGQTWSTFQDVGALPDNLDFVGPAESTVFERQAQIRYTSGPFEFALENPETTITNATGGRVIGREGMPDVIGRYTFNMGGGYVKVAGMVRQLHTADGAVDDNEMGYGVSLSGKHPFGSNDLRWMFTSGSGTGRYLGLNTANDAALDANGNLEAIDQWGAFVSYRHMWNDAWWSNVTYGVLENDHDVALTGATVTKSVSSIHLNLQHAPTPKMMVGAEIMFAERETEAGLKGDMTRFIFSAKYSF